MRAIIGRVLRTFLKLQSQSKRARERSALARGFGEDAETPRRERGPYPPPPSHKLRRAPLQQRYLIAGSNWLGLEAFNIQRRLRLLLRRSRLEGSVGWSSAVCASSQRIAPPPACLWFVF